MHEPILAMFSGTRQFFPFQNGVPRIQQTAAKMRAMPLTPWRSSLCKYVAGDYPSCPIELSLLLKREVLQYYQRPFWKATVELNQDSTRKLLTYCTSLGLNVTIEDLESSDYRTVYLTGLYFQSNGERTLDLPKECLALMLRSGCFNRAIESLVGVSHDLSVDEIAHILRTLEPALDLGDDETRFEDETHFKALCESIAEDWLKFEFSADAAADVKRSCLLYSLEKHKVFRSMRERIGAIHPIRTRIAIDRPFSALFYSVFYFLGPLCERCRSFEELVSLKTCDQLYEAAGLQYLTSPHLPICTSDSVSLDVYEIFDVFLHENRAIRLKETLTSLDMLEDALDFFADQMLESNSMNQKFRAFHEFLWTAQGFTEEWDLYRTPVLQNFILNEEEPKTEQESSHNVGLAMWEVNSFANRGISTSAFIYHQ